MIQNNRLLEDKPQMVEIKNQVIIWLTKLKKTKYRQEYKYERILSIFFFFQKTKK